MEQPMEVDPRDRIKDKVALAWRTVEEIIASGVTREEAEKNEGEPFATFVKCFMDVYRFGMEDGGQIAIDMYSKEIQERFSKVQGAKE
jgi:hypothetical protein